MSSTISLKSILDELHFTDYEQEAFQKAISDAREYMKGGSVDIEKSFRELVEGVARHEIQEDKI